MGPLVSREVIIKVIGGKMFAEDDMGQMVIIKKNGKVQSYLATDESWVKGHTDDPWGLIGELLELDDFSWGKSSRREVEFEPE
jgi:hypothetical protein